MGKLVGRLSLAVVVGVLLIILLAPVAQARLWMGQVSMIYVPVWEVQEDGSMVEKSWSYADAGKQILIEQDVLFDMPFYYRDLWPATKSLHSPQGAWARQIAVDVMVISHFPEDQGGGTEVSTKRVSGYPGLFPIDISDMVNPSAVSIELRTLWMPLIDLAGDTQLDLVNNHIRYEQLNLWFNDLGNGMWERMWPVGQPIDPVL